MCEFAKLPAKGDCKMCEANRRHDQLTRMRMTAAAHACVLTIVLAMCASSGVALAEQGNPEIAPIGSRITSVDTYADFGAKWWQWVLQAPAADNPLSDPTGEKCRVGQQGPVWFLAGTLGSGVPTERHCQLPAGKAIFFPVINLGTFGFLSDPPEERTAGFLRARLARCDSNSIRNISVKIDGATVARPTRFATT